VGAAIKIGIAVLAVGNAFVLYCMLRVAAMEDAWMEAHLPQKEEEDIE